MTEIKRMYMVVSIDVTPLGLNMWAQISPVDIWVRQNDFYPHIYTHVSPACTWIIHSTGELSEKTKGMLTEYADKSCAHATKKNQNRKVLGR